MLATVRRHVDLGLKIILGIIIVTFVLFFGYTSLRQKVPDTTAIRVGKTDIPYSLYRFFQRNQYERLQESFKGEEIPEFLQKSLVQSLNQQMIQQALAIQFATKLGIQVTDEELADFIRKESDFDPVAYKDFLARFYLENGFPYENYVRDQLLLQKFQNTVMKMEEEATSEVEGKKWTFETIQIEGENKDALIQGIQDLWKQKKEAAPLLKKNNLKSEKIGPISLKERHQLFRGLLSLEEYPPIFKLQKPFEWVGPIKQNQKTLLVRLISIEEISKEEKKEEATSTYYPQFRLVDFWFQNFAKDTSVQTFTSEETQ